MTVAEAKKVVLARYPKAKLSQRTEDGRRRWIIDDGNLYGGILTWKLCDTEGEAWKLAARAVGGPASP